MNKPIDTETTLGQRIRQKRLENGLTQKQLGALCGILEPAIRTYELNKQNPKIETLTKIANALNVPVAHLRPELETVSVWSDFEEKYPNIGRDVKEIEVFVNYLSTLDFSALYMPAPGSDVYYEDVIENGEIIGRSQVVEASDYEVRLTKGRQSVVFTSKEYEELQTATKDVIETRFYKKLLDK